MTSITRKELTARFWEKVWIGPDCWLWSGMTDGAGYGLLKINRRKRRAHRLSYELANGLIPSGQVVRHSCNNPACVRPSHLLLGTHADNVRDRCEAGHTAKGEHNGRAKLTELDVVEIRRMLDDGASHALIALRFNISRRLVYAISKNLLWKHVA